MTAPDSTLFEYAHLPEGLQLVSRRFAELASFIERRLPAGVERDMALRKLLESKDCAVRARMIGDRYQAVPGAEPTIAEEIVAALREFDPLTPVGFAELVDYLDKPAEQIELHLALLIVQGQVLQVADDPQTDFTDLRAATLTLPQADG